MFLFSNFVIIILNLNLNLVNTCSFFDSKKVCECGVIYTKGLDNELKKLFDLPSFEKCGNSLDCDLSDCAEKCLLKARNVLGNSEYDVNLKLKNKLCELIAPDNEPIFR